MFVLGKIESILVVVDAENVGGLKFPQKAFMAFIKELQDIWCCTLHKCLVLKGQRTLVSAYNNLKCNFFPPYT